MNKNQRERKKKKARAQRDDKSSDARMDREGNQTLDTDESAKAKEKTHSKPQSWMKGLKEWMGRDKSFTDWTVAVFTAVLATFAILQGLTLNGQLREMKLDQRAWLSVTVTPLQPVKGQPVRALIHVENIGKTPAKAVSEDVVVETRKITEAPSFDYTTRENDFISLLFPKGVDEWPSSHLTPVATGVAVPIGITDGEFTELTQAGQSMRYVVAFGKISFRDIDDTQHWVHFCAWHGFFEGEVVIEARKCTEYNNIDNN